MSTASRVIWAIDSWVTTGDAANPQAPFAITRTPKPKLVSSETNGASRVLLPPRSGDIRIEMS